MGHSRYKTDSSESEAPRLKRRGFLKILEGGLHPTYPRTAFTPAINGGVFCGIFIKSKVIVGSTAVRLTS